MWHYHFVSELNLIEHHLSKGDRVTLLKCDASLEACEANPQHQLAHCLRCMGIRDHGSSLISAPIRILPLIDTSLTKKRCPISVAQFRTIEELKGLKWKNFDIGWAVYSSLVDREGSEHPDIQGNRKLIQRLLLDAWSVFETADHMLRREKVDRVYVFNGRYAAARPWMRACESHGVTFVTHEKSSSLNRIFLYENSIPHTTVGWPERMEAFWKLNGAKAEVLKEATDFYEERPKGLMTGWVSYTAHQKAGTLPDNWNPQAKNIVIFSSTSREYAGIKDMVVDSIFPSQLEAYSFIAKELKTREPETQVYLRIHPNSAEDKYRWWEEFDLLTKKRIQIIPPESQISSYHLLWAASIAVTPFSTIGAEATYWGVPSVVVDRPYYCGIDAVYEPETPQEIVQLLCGRLDAKPKINALKYSAYLRCGGFSLENSEPVNYYTLKFKSQILEARREVHEWLGECEKRPPVSGFKKWLQDRKDRRDFKRLWAECNGWFAKSPKSHQNVI